MGITHLSGLSVSGSGTSLSGVSVGNISTSAVSAGQISASGISLEGTGVISLLTVATEASTVTHSLALLHQASGITLCWRSGDTLYLFAAVSNISVAI